MLQIISQLSKHGLSENRDDRYFMKKLDNLVESIRQWARLFSQGQPPLTRKDLKVAWKMAPVQEYFISAFLEIRSLLKAKNLGDKVRMRLVEVILLRALMGERLWKRHIGFLECDYRSHKNLIQGMKCTSKWCCSL